MSKLAYNTKELAAALGVTPAAIRKACERGKIKHRKFGTKIIIPASEAQRIAEGQGHISLGGLSPEAEAQLKPAQRNSPCAPTSRPDPQNERSAR